LKLKDKVVLITDGASPTGLEIAERFKAEGAILCLNVSRDILVSAASLSEGIDKALAVRRAAAIATLLAEDGVLVHANPVVKEEVDAGVATVLDKYGRIDVVVHNNNEVIRATLEDCSDEAFDMTMEINAKSALLFAQAAAAPMKKAAKGNFVFISSIHDEKPSGAAFAYSLAKGALKMLVKEMVLDLGPHNIRANIVNMGPMEGHEELFSSSVSPLYEHTKERIANMRLCTLEEVANAALFFASDDCPSANGCSLSLDGGFLLSYFSGRKRK
jgi:NAD(P)-dependent dehydrogenase (short-subunit alcohol dehydrogenase family)